MIIYFSATGNSRYVAEKVAEATGDKAYSIEEISNTLYVSEKAVLGMVFPTYAWELPINVREFLENIKLEGCRDMYVFFVATYGTTPGATGSDAARILKKKGISVNARFCVRMPDTWTPVFDLSNQNKVVSQNQKAENEITEIIQRIKSREYGNFMKRTVPHFFRYFSDIAYSIMRKTKHFSVEETCIGCKLCAKQCPAKAIAINAGRPVWTSDRCIMCLRCLHNCPKFSIQYGRKTKKHGQYVNPNVR